MKRPGETFIGTDLHRYTFEDEGVQVDLQQLHAGRDGEIICDAEITTSRPPAPGLLAAGRFNLRSVPTRTQWQRRLEGRIPEGVDWGGALEYVCKRSTDHYRRGDPVVDLRELELKDGPRQLVEDLVESEGATIIFADGGSGKSTLAEALAVSVASGTNILAAAPRETCSVLIVDWETNADAHGEIFRAICAGADLDYRAVPVHYQRMSAGMVEAAPMLRRKLADIGARFVIVDSLGAARNGEPESAAETIRMFNAARSLGVPWLGVDHVTKSTGETKTRPFGSTYTHNLARRTWGLIKTSEENSSRLTIALTNYKANTGHLARRRGYHVDFEDDEYGRTLTITFTPCDVRDVPAFAGSLSNKERIVDILRANNGAMTIADIETVAEAEGRPFKPVVVKTTLNRHKDTFVQVNDGRTIRWGLLLRAYADA